MPRRDQFRRARDGVLNACGTHTLHLQAAAPLRRRAPGDTLADPPHADSAIPLVSLCLRDPARRSHPLKVGINTLGRLPDNDIVVSDAHVSRRHCSIIVHTTQRCEVHDTASKNGTSVNGQRVGCPTALHLGDEIRVGDMVMVLADSSHDNPRATDPDQGEGTHPK